MYIKIILHFTRTQREDNIQGMLDEDSPSLPRHSCFKNYSCFVESRVICRSPGEVNLEELQVT